jgi:hypothetical protein
MRIVSGALAAAGDPQPAAYGSWSQKLLWPPTTGMIQIAENKIATVASSRTARTFWFGMPPPRSG